MSRQLKLPVPVHVVTGGLGAGKTSFIQELLKQKPQDERWGLVINEFGAVGIDQAVLAAADVPGGDGTVNVKELAGGCMCCTLSGVTSVAIAQLLRAIKPDRLWIEPSGLGHPAQLVDVLKGEHLASALDLQPIICLVDVVQFRPARLPWGSQPAFWANELYRDQVSIADILIGSKADLGGPEAVKGFVKWAGEFYPPKQVLTSVHGKVDLDAASGAAADALSLAQLSISASSQEQQQQLQQDSACSGGSAVAEGQLPPAANVAVPVSRVKGSAQQGSLVWLSNAEQPAGPLPGKPQRKEARDVQQGMVACGWVFHPDDVFRRLRLLRFLELCQQAVPRVKGIFRVSPKTWVSASAGMAAGGGPVQLQEVAYRRDSRLELIVPLAGAQESSAAAAAAAAAADASAQQPAAASGAQPGAGTAQPGGGPSSSSGASSPPAAMDAASLAAAIEHGQQGDWSWLEAMVLGLLQS